MHTASYTSFIPGQAYLVCLLLVHKVADVLHVFCAFPCCWTRLFPPPSSK